MLLGPPQNQFEPQAFTGEVSFQSDSHLFFGGGSQGGP